MAAAVTMQRIESDIQQGIRSAGVESVKWIDKTIHPFFRIPESIRFTSFSSSFRLFLLFYRACYFVSFSQRFVLLVFIVFFSRPIRMSWRTRRTRRNNKRGGRSEIKKTGAPEPIKFYTNKIKRHGLVQTA